MLIRIPRYDYFINSVDFNPGDSVLYESAVTSGTETTLTDNSANWIENQWKDKIVRIKRNDEIAIVAMKTSSTMTITEGSIDLIEF